MERNDLSSGSPCAASQRYALLERVIAVTLIFVAALARPAHANVSPVRRWKVFTCEVLLSPEVKDLNRSAGESTAAGHLLAQLLEDQRSATLPWSRSTLKRARAIDHLRGLIGRLQHPSPQRKAMVIEIEEDDFPRARRAMDLAEWRLDSEYREALHADRKAGPTGRVHPALFRAVDVALTTAGLVGVWLTSQNLVISPDTLLIDPVSDQITSMASWVGCVAGVSAALVTAGVPAHYYIRKYDWQYDRVRARLAASAHQSNSKSVYFSTTPFSVPREFADLIFTQGLVGRRQGALRRARTSFTEHVLSPDPSARSGSVCNAQGLRELTLTQFIYFDADRKQSRYVIILESAPMDPTESAFTKNPAGESVDWTLIPGTQPGT